MKRWLLVSALLLLVAGCAVRPGRLADLSDCGSLSVGVGPGLAVNARVGHLAHPAFGLGAFSWRVGHEWRAVSGTWQEAEYVAPLLWYLADEKMDSLWASRSWYTSNWPGGSGFYGTDDAWFGPPIAATEEAKFHTLGKVEIGVTLVIVGARVGVNPPELADFFLGFFGLDIAGDDDVPLRVEEEGQDNRKPDVIPEVPNDGGPAPVPQ